MERLITAFPDVLFEGCSGGGGRFDLGILYYMPQIWCSDDTDAVERLRIQYGTSMIYPTAAIGAHVSECPNQQTGRSVPISTRAAVAYFGTFGYELDLGRLSPKEQEAVKEQIAYYKTYGEVITQGDYYRLTDVTRERGYAAWQSVSADRSTSVIGYMQLRTAANAGIVYIYPRGLCPDTVYRIKELELEISGSALMYAGLPMPDLKGDYETRLFTLVSCAGAAAQDCDYG